MLSHKDALAERSPFLTEIQNIQVNVLLLEFTKYIIDGIIANAIQGASQGNDLTKSMSRKKRARILSDIENKIFAAKKERLEELLHESPLSAKSINDLMQKLACYLSLSPKEYESQLQKFYQLFREQIEYLQQNYARRNKLQLNALQEFLLVELGHFFANSILQKEEIEKLATELAHTYLANIRDAFMLTMYHWETFKDSKKTIDMEKLQKPNVASDELSFLHHVQKYADLFGKKYIVASMQANFLATADYQVLYFYEELFKTIKNDSRFCDIFCVNEIPDQYVKKIIAHIFALNNLPLEILSEPTSAKTLLDQFNNLHSSYPEIPSNLTHIHFAMTIHNIIKDKDFWDVFGKNSELVAQIRLLLKTKWNHTAESAKELCINLFELGQKFQNKSNNEANLNLAALCRMGLQIYADPEQFPQLQNLQYQMGEKISDPKKCKNFIKLVEKIASNTAYWQTKGEGWLGTKVPDGVTDILKMIEKGKHKESKIVLEEIQQYARKKMMDGKKRDPETTAFYLYCSRLSYPELFQFNQKIVLPLFSEEKKEQTSSSEETTTPILSPQMLRSLELETLPSPQPVKKALLLQKALDTLILPLAKELLSLYDLKTLGSTYDFREDLQAALDGNMVSEKSRQIAILFENLKTQLGASLNSIFLVGKNTINIVLDMNLQQPTSVILQLYECRAAHLDNLQNCKLSFLVTTYKQKACEEMHVPKKFLSDNDWNKKPLEYQVVVEFKEFIANSDFEKKIKRLHQGQFNSTSEKELHILQSILPYALQFIDIAQELIQKNMVWTDMKINNFLVELEYLSVSDTKALIFYENIILSYNSTKKCLTTTYEANTNSEDFSAYGKEHLFSYPCASDDLVQEAQKARAYFRDLWALEYNYRIGTMLLTMWKNFDPNAIAAPRYDSPAGETFLNILQALTCEDPAKRMSLEQAHTQFLALQNQLTRSAHQAINRPTVLSHSGLFNKNTHLLEKETEQENTVNRKPSPKGK